MSKQNTLSFDTGTAHIGWALTINDVIEDAGCYNRNISKIPSRTDRGNARRSRNRVKNKRSLKKQIIELFKKHDLIDDTFSVNDKRIKEDSLYNLKYRIDGLRKKISNEQLLYVTLYYVKSRGHNYADSKSYTEIENERSEEDSQIKAIKEKGKKGKVDKEISFIPNAIILTEMEKLGIKYFSEYQEYLLNNGQSIKDLKKEEILIKDELEVILSNQDLPDSFLDEIQELIFHRKGWRLNRFLRRRCPFLPEITVADKFSPYFQEYRILETINNIRVRRYGEELPLEVHEKQKLFEIMNNGSKLNITIKSIAKILDEKYFNYDHEQSFKCNYTAYYMNKLFGKKWLTYSKDEQLNILNGLLVQKRPDKYLENNKDNFDLDQKNIDKFLSSSYKKIEYGSAPYSTYVLKCIMEFMKPDNDVDPHVQNGRNYNQNDEYLDDILLNKWGLKLQNNTTYNLLKYWKPSDEVMSILSDIKKIIKHLSKKHGINPDNTIINIESSKVDGSMSVESYIYNQNENETKNNNARKFIDNKKNENDKAKLGILNSNNKSHVERVRLAQEQKFKCVYSGKSLSEYDIIYNTEIDHIIPQSKSGDSTIDNKVLVFTEENQNKGSDVLYDYLGKTKLNKLEERLRKDKYPISKLKRMLIKNHDIEKSMLRHSNTHSYATKYITKYLKADGYTTQVFKPNIIYNIAKKLELYKHIHPINKNVKIREDLRNHVIDAIAISQATNSIRLSIDNGNEFVASVPYDRFHCDVSMILKKDGLMKTKIHKKTNRPLFKSTAMGIYKKDNTQKTERKDLITYLSDKGTVYKRINNIIDHNIRQIVLKEISKFLNSGIDGDVILKRSIFHLPEDEIKNILDKYNSQIQKYLKDKTIKYNGNVVKKVKVAYKRGLEFYNKKNNSLYHSAGYVGVVVGEDGKLTPLRMIEWTQNFDELKSEKIIFRGSKFHKDELNITDEQINKAIECHPHLEKAFMECETYVFVKVDSTGRAEFRNEIIQMDESNVRFGCKCIVL